MILYCRNKECISRKFFMANMCCLWRNITALFPYLSSNQHGWLVFPLNLIERICFHVFRRSPIFKNFSSNNCDRVLINSDRAESRTGYRDKKTNFKTCSKKLQFEQIHNNSSKKYFKLEISYYKGLLMILIEIKRIKVDTK